MLGRLLAAIMLLSCLNVRHFAAAQVTGTGSYIPPGNYVPTPVPFSPTLLGIYADDAPGSFEGVDAWLGRPIDFSSIHVGQASESDFINSVGYVLWSSQYTGVNAAGVADSRLVSVPLIWQGATLAAAASGAYNADYAIVAQRVLAAIPPGPAPGQSIIYIRTGWEQNLAGEMPWSASGIEPQYIAAFQQFVSTFRAADPTGRFRFVWCPNVGGDPIALSYPGDSYVDVISMDFYYGLSQQTSAPDPDVAFQEMLDTGLTAVASMATSQGKRLAFSEWGVNRDNFGSYIKDFFDWCRSQGCLYVTYWDNNAGLPDKLSDGSYPETGAMFRHLWNSAKYPVEPIAAPANISALAGEGSNLITANPVTSSTPVTTYYLYAGQSSGGESIVPVATSNAPYFNVVQPNGQTGYYRMGAGNALSLGYLSTEVHARPRAPSSLPLPPDYLAIAQTGYAVSSTASLVALSQSVTPLNQASITALIAPSSQNAGLVAGFPNGLALRLDGSGRLLGFSRDYWGNQSWAASTLPVPYPADGRTPEWVRVDFDTQAATTTFYVAPVNGAGMPRQDGPAWSQLGAVQNGQNHNSIWDGSPEAFYVGGQPSGDQVAGSVYDTALYVAGVLVTHPHFDLRAPGTTSFQDAHAKLWQVGGGALIH